MPEQEGNHKELYGFLHPKKDRQGNQPHFSGNILIEGKLWELAAWGKSSKSGVRYLSLKAQEAGGYQGDTDTDPPPF